MLSKEYRYFRHQGLPAMRALEKARQWQAMDKPTPWINTLSIGGNPPAKDRWIDPIDQSGLRFVAWADEILSLCHTGYYCNEFCDSTYRGAVYQLTGKGGNARYLAAYVESDSPQSALVHMSISGNKTQCARNADYLADRSAEKAREYDETCCKASNYQEMQHSLKNQRAIIYAQASLLRQNGKDNPLYGAARLAFSQCVKEFLQTLRELEKLEDEFYYWEDGRSVTIQFFAAKNI